jgi:hypothetical protein
LNDKPSQSRKAARVYQKFKIAGSEEMARDVTKARRNF